MNVKNKQVNILDSTINYVEAGEGDPILFLHGVPTSSYLWRNIIPHLTSLGRCIAPDLIGFGKSGKPDINYTIHDHIKYIDHFIDALKLKNVILVMHGWGSIIGFNYAMNHEKNCKGLVFYEAFLRSFDAETISLPYQEQIASCQEQANLYNPITSGIEFVDSIIPQIIMRELSEVEIEQYRAPFNSNGSAKPIIQYLAELPNENSNGAVEKIIDEYSKKLERSTLPKLMLYSIPGFVTTIALVMWAKEHLPNLELIDIGEELHLGQESYPDVIGEAISIWLQGVEQS